MALETTTHSLRWAWVTMGLALIAMIPAMLVAEGLIVVMGFDVTHQEPLPLWAGALLSVLVLVLELTPSALAVMFGLRARREGREIGLVPAIVGGLAGAYYLITAVIGLIGWAIGA